MEGSNWLDLILGGLALLIAIAGLFFLLKGIMAMEK